MHVDNDILAQLHVVEAIARGAAANASRANSKSFVNGGNAFGALGGLLAVTDGNGLQIESSGGPISIAPSAPPGGGSVIAMGLNIALSAQASSTFSTSAGSITIGPFAALTLTAGAASVWSTTAGALTVQGATSLALVAAGGAASLDATAALNLAQSSATSVVIGNATNCASLAINLTAANISTTGNVIAGGFAAPATLNGLVCTINGTARKILFCAT